MLRKLLKNKKAQNTAEYAILISLVVAGIIAMQTYAQRALQARVRDASQFLATTTNGIGNAVQYEPYYLSTNYLVSRSDAEARTLGSQGFGMATDSTRTRGSAGSQVSTFDTTLDPGIVGNL